MKPLLAVLISMLAASSAVAAGPQLALPGEGFHGDEVPARNGETWWALVVDGGSARLQSSVVAVKAVEDPILDEAGQTSGRSVAAPGLQPLVLLRGLPALKSGAVPLALELPEARALAPDEKIALVLGERRWSLSNRCTKVTNDPVTSDGQSYLDCAVVLDDGKTVQELAEGDSNFLREGEPPVVMVSLLFAGDLDNDGRVDLLIDTSDHANVTRPTLFLSGAATKGTHVKQVAQQELTGC